MDDIIYKKSHKEYLLNHFANMAEESKVSSVDIIFGYQDQDFKGWNATQRSYYVRLSAGNRNLDLYQISFVRKLGQNEVGNEINAEKNIEALGEVSFAIDKLKKLGFRTNMSKHPVNERDNELVMKLYANAN